MYPQIVQITHDYSVGLNSKITGVSYLKKIITTLIKIEIVGVEKKKGEKKVDNLEGYLSMHTLTKDPQAHLKQY